VSVLRSTRLRIWLFVLGVFLLFVGMANAGILSQIGQRTGRIRLAGELVALKALSRGCNRLPEAQACRDQLTVRFPQYDAAADLVAVRVVARAELTEQQILDWAAELPEGLFFLDSEPRTRVNQRGRTTTRFDAWVAPHRISRLRRELADLFDRGRVLISDSYVPVYSEQFVSSETWLLPQQPDDPDSATECVDPLVHHAYVTAAAEITADIDQVLQQPQMPQPWDVNDPFGGHGDPEERVLLTAEHRCARQGMGISDLCDAAHDAGPDPLQRGLVELWEGSALPLSASIPASGLDSDLVDALEQLHEGFLGVTVTAEAPVIGYRDGARAWTRGTDLDDHVDLTLDIPLYIFPATNAQIILVWEDQQQETTFVEIELIWPRSRWDVAADFDLDLTADVEDLANGTRLPWRQAVVASLTNHEVEVVLFSGGAPELAAPPAFLDPDTFVPEEAELIDDLFPDGPVEAEPGDLFGDSLRGPLDPGDAQLADGLADIVDGLQELEGELQTPFMWALLYGVLGDQLEEWAEGIGPFLGRYALEMNPRLGGDDQHPLEQGFAQGGITGLSVADRAEFPSGLDECGKSWWPLDDAPVLGGVDQGLVLVMDGYDATFSPSVPIDGRDVGAARWVVMEPEQLEALTSIAQLRDPESQPTGMYPGNPLRTEGVEAFLGNLVFQAMEIGVTSIDDDFCEDRWADRELQELDACDDLCLEVCTVQGGGLPCLAGCTDGCDSYYTGVETTWNAACAEPDYLMDEEPGGFPFCASVRKDSMALTDPQVTGAPRPFFGEVTEVVNQETVVGCNFLACNTDYALEGEMTYEEVYMAEYRPPVYLTEHLGQVELHIPVGLTFQFDVEMAVDAHVDLEPGDGDEACPAIPSPGNPSGLEDARDAFDAWDGYQGTQTLRGTGELAADVEWIFPVELDRRWEFGSRFWADAAEPVWPVPVDEPRAVVSLDLGLSSLCFHLDEEGSSFEALEHPGTGLTAPGGSEEDIADEVVEALEDPCDNQLTWRVNGMLGLANAGLPAFDVPFVAPDFLDWAEEQMEEYPIVEKRETAIALGAGGLGTTLGLGEHMLPPPAYRALIWDYPLEQWVREDLLENLDPAATMMIPRWMVLDDWWRQHVCPQLADDGIDCWETLAAMSGSNLEEGFELVTAPDGSPIGEGVEDVWPVSYGAAGWLLFEPTYSTDHPPAPNQDPAPPHSYTRAGYLDAPHEYGWTGGLESQELEEPALLPEWEPGRTGP